VTRLRSRWKKTNERAAAGRPAGRVAFACAPEKVMSKEKPKKQAQKSLKEKRREKKAKQGGTSVGRLS
jgi:hypothetical protein